MDNVKLTKRFNTAMIALEAASRRLSTRERLLIQVHASRLNGCSFCEEMHAGEAAKKDIELTPINACEELILELTTMGTVLGDWHRSEDVVQEALLRCEEHKPDNPAAWLSRVTVRLAIDEARVLERSKENYVGEWLPDFVAWAAADTNVEEEFDVRDDVDSAITRLVQVLSPVDRAVIVLMDVMGFPSADVARRPILGHGTLGGDRTGLGRAHSGGAGAAEPREAIGGRAILLWKVLVEANLIICSSTLNLISLT
ncbi:carboxymuconolactone decarboxylase family protein [Corynebacterium falsenii]